MSTPPTVYEVKVAGHLDDHWSDWLDGFTLTRRDDGTTSLTGAVADQAQLHGLLSRLGDVGVELVTLQAADPPPPALTQPLTTERLTLRAPQTADAMTTWRYRRLPEVNEWLTGCPPTLEGYVELFTSPDRLGTTVIVELHDGTVIGDFMLRRHDAWAQVDVAEQARGRQAELGWVLDPAHTGHGYASEAVHELLRHCFTHLGVHRVTADCFHANEASWRLMERVGMRREAHTRRDALHHTGHWLDSVSYALLADEWPATPRHTPPPSKETP